MKFKKEDLLAGLCRDNDDFKTIEDEVYDTSRWSAHHDWTFEYGGKYYNTSYSIGLTEYQDESPFENEGDEIECTEVFKAVIATEQFVTAEKLEELRGNAKLIFPK